MVVVLDVVLVGGTVVDAGAEVDVGAAGVVVLGVVAGVVTVVDGEVVDDVGSFTGGPPEPAVVEGVEGDELALTFGEIPSVSGADLVWNASTPASPAIVVMATMGARFIGLISLSQMSSDSAARRQTSRDGFCRSARQADEPQLRRSG